MQPKPQWKSHLEGNKKYRKNLGFLLSDICYWKYVYLHICQPFREYIVGLEYYNYKATYVYKIGAKAKDEARLQTPYFDG